MNPANLTATQTASAFRSGGGDMGARVRAFDWAATPLGPISSWSAALRVTVDQMLASKFPACLFWGPDLVAIYNDGYRVILGQKPEALGEPMRVTWREVWDAIGPIAQKALAGESTFIENYPLRLERNGSAEDAWFTFNYGPVFDENGGVVGMLDTVVETTEQMQAELRRVEERDRQLNLLQQMPGFVAVLNGPAHVFDYVNDAYKTIAAHRPLLGLSVREAFPELTGQGFHELLDGVYASGQPYQAKAIPVRFNDGVDRFVDLLYTPIRGAAGAVQGIFVGGYEITERVRAETNLRELNVELESRVIEKALARGRTWQLSPELLGVLNAGGYFEASNPAWMTVLGWTEAEVAGSVFFDFIHPDDLSKTQGVWADATLRAIPALRFENRYRCKDGSYRWLSWVAVPEDGKVYCSARDVTDQKEQAVALESAETALRQAQKMEAVGQLTGGIAHDFNNLLAGIGGSLQMMQRRIQAGKFDGLERYLDMSEASVRRAAALTQRLLAFSRRQTLDPKPIDVSRLVSGMAELIRSTVGPNVNVEVMDAEVWPTTVDASQLENALLNLCINARDAMLPSGGHLTIQSANHSFNDRQAAAHELTPGDYVSLCVTDTGTGMPADVVKRIFDPFYTTKPMGQGTGLGLSMVYGFVRQSGGQVKVDSRVGRGTTLCIYLPRFAGGTAEEALAAAAEASGPGNGETVLLIEDEDIVREIVSEVLTEAGYRVLVAGDGATGLNILQSDRRIDLLLTDVGLPGGMNGRQVADAGRVVRPGLKVLFVTGYAENAAVGNGVMEPGMEVMSKPFEIEALSKKVRDMLDSSPA